MASLRAVNGLPSSPPAYALGNSRRQGSNLPGPPEHDATRGSPTHFAYRRSGILDERVAPATERWEEVSARRRSTSSELAFKNETANGRAFLAQLVSRAAPALARPASSAPPGAAWADDRDPRRQWTRPIDEKMVAVPSRIPEIIRAVTTRTPRLRRRAAVCRDRDDLAGRVCCVPARGGNLTARWRCSGGASTTEPTDLGFHNCRSLRQAPADASGGGWHVRCLDVTIRGVGGTAHTASRRDRSSAQRSSSTRCNDHHPEIAPIHSAVLTLGRIVAARHGTSLPRSNDPRCAARCGDPARSMLPCAGPRGFEGGMPLDYISSDQARARAAERQAREAACWVCRRLVPRTSSDASPTWAAGLRLVASACLRSLAARSKSTARTGSSGHYQLNEKASPGHDRLSRAVPTCGLGVVVGGCSRRAVKRPHSQRGLPTGSPR